MTERASCLCIRSSKSVPGNAAPQGFLFANKSHAPYRVRRNSNLCKQKFAYRQKKRANLTRPHGFRFRYLFCRCSSFCRFFHYGCFVTVIRCPSHEYSFGSNFPLSYSTTEYDALVGKLTTDAHSSLGSPSILHQKARRAAA